MHRSVDQPSFADVYVSGNLGQNESLERIDRTVDWEGFRRLVQEASTGRRKAGPAILFSRLYY